MGSSRGTRPASVLFWIVALVVLNPAQGLSVTPADAVEAPVVEMQEATVRVEVTTAAVTGATRPTWLPSTDLLLVVVEVRTPEEWYRVRRLGLPADRLGSREYQVTSEVVTTLAQAGIPFHIIGGTTRVKLPADLLSRPSTQAAVNDSAREPAPPLDSGTIALNSGPLDIYIEDNTGTAQAVHMSNPSAPAGAQVTELRYQTRISDEGDGNIYCGDFEIWLYSTSDGPAWELIVYDNLGGGTDGGFDDDAEDDEDIYLNWRATSYFNGEDPNQSWGIIVWDNITGDDGQLDYLEFEIDWEVTSGGDGFEPDNDSTQAYDQPHNSISAPRSIDPADDEDWIKFTLTELSDVTIETIGPAGDTRLWLYDASLNQIEYDDDDGTGFFSQIVRSGAEALGPGLYYAQVDDFGNDDIIPDYGIELTVDPSGGGQPDLVTTGWSSPSLTPTEGDAFYVEPDIVNQGTAAAGSSHTRLFLSLDDDFDVSDDYEILPEKSVGALGPSGQTTVRWDFSFPDLLDLSTYSVWIVVEVDSQDEVAESSENNVFKAVGALTVTDAPAGSAEIRIEPLSLDFDFTSARPWSPKEPLALDLGPLSAKAEADGSVRVIVGLDVTVTPEGYLSQAQMVGRQRAAIADKQATVLTRLGGSGFRVTALFRFINYMALEVDTAALGRLAALPEVTSIQEDHLASPTMASSVPVIGADDAWAAGFDGSGQTVAILDTGVDKTHPFFSTGGSKVVSEACYSTTYAPNNSTSVCPGGVAQSTAPGSGVNCSLVVNGCKHGTHVSGSAAGNDGTGPDYGVGRGAEVIAIQVFSRFDSNSSCGSSTPCALSYDSDQIKGLERVYALRSSYDIAAANMSLGGGRYYDETSCNADNTATKAAIDNLLSVDIATVISSGNDDYRDSMGAPGCISTAVSVGATTDTDVVASFSNIATFIDLLAPGVSITSSVPGGGKDTWQGTSMAAPHVTGAWAVLKQASPTASVSEVLAALRATGTVVNDNRSGGTVTGMRRINVDLALDALGPGTGGNFTIFNDGEATLNVTSIALDSAAVWISWSPQAPFDVPAAGSQAVEVTVNENLAPAGFSQRRLLVHSNDADESPYPGGVWIDVTTEAGACYTLTTGHTGQGSDPQTSPGSSAGCAAGQYHAGEQIQLTANPAAGWQVSGWSGTDNNSSTSTVNTATMPAGAHSVSVSYTESPTGFLGKLVPSDPVADAYFGSSVGVSGDTVVVGAPDHGSVGAAYVFERDHGGTGQWGQVKKLVPADGIADREFGSAVAISGDTIAIGAHPSWVDGMPGTVYIFERNHGGAGNWGERKTIQAPEAAEGDSFGYAVAIDGDTLAVGAITDGSSNQGAAWIFERDQGGSENWGMVRKVIPTDQAAGVKGWFGIAVALDSNLLVVGELFDSSISDAGTAYIFARNQGGTDNWGQLKKKTGGHADDRFGSAVAVSGDTVAIGAHLDDDTGFNSGSVSVYRQNSGGANNWGLARKLLGDGNYSMLGSSVGTLTDILVAGAPDQLGNTPGLAQVFDRDLGGTNNWGEIDRLSAFDGSNGDKFGGSADIDGATIVIGAAVDDGSGSAYLFELETTTPCYTLTLAHTGQGTNPQASPGNSSGCAAGTYTAGEQIQLTASPATGWAVGSWSGTANNTSTSTINSVAMPAANHTATVHYVESSGIPDYLHLHNLVVSTTAVFEACIEILAGPDCELTASADVVLRAPSIVLDADFSVLSGARLTADTSTPSGCTARPD